MSTFIGREQDLAVLHRCLQDALQGKGKVAFIIGEAGIGKTTLIEEFKAQHLDRLNEDFRTQGKKTPEIRFADAKCNELAGKGEPYAPFFEIIAQFVTDDKAFGSSKLAEIVREVGSDWFELVPVIGKALSLISKTFFKWHKSDDVRQLAERQVQKDKLIQEFTHILKRMSDEHPLVLFLDDLHWADDSTIALLFHIARHLQEQRILILGTYRPTDIEVAHADKTHPLKDVVYELHRYNLCATIKLGYFTKAQVQGFLDVHLSQHNLDAAFATYLHDLTEGNPLFVTEYVKLLQEIGKLAQTGGVWRLQGSITDNDMPIPTSVEKVIEKRVERLKEELQKTLKYASVNGEQFNSLVLAKLLNWDEMDLLENLESLVRVHQLVKEIILVPGQMQRGAAYQFIHSLVQKSLYATLSAGIKSKLHAKAAEILEEVYHDDLDTVAEELVEHYSRGQNHAQAAKYALIAARKANRQAGFLEASNHAQHGLEFLKLTGAKTPDQPMLRLQIELLLELAAAEEAIGEAKNSIDHAETAAKLAEMVDEQSFQGDIFFQVGNLLLSNRATVLDRVLTYLEKALEINVIMKSYENVISVLEIMRSTCSSLGKGDYFIQHCLGIICLNEQAKQKDLNVFTLKLIAWMFYDQGKYQEAYQNATESLNIALTMERHDLQIELFQPVIQYGIRAGNFSEVSKHYEYAKNIVNKVMDTESKKKAFYKLGECAWAMSKPDEALEFYQIAKEAAFSNGDLKSEAMILATLLSKSKAIGKFNEAGQYGLACLEIRQKLGRVDDVMSAFDNLGFVFRDQGNYSKAIEMRQQAITLSRNYGRDSSLASYLSSYSIDLIINGKFKESVIVIKEALKTKEKVNDLNGIIECLTILALSYFLLGDTDNALSVMDNAKESKYTNYNRRFSLFLSLRYAHILIGVGDYNKANNILEETIIEGIKREEYYGDFPVYLIDSALIYLIFDEIEKSLESLSQIEKYFRNHVFAEGIAMLKNAYAQAYMAQGNFTKAEASIKEAITLFQQMHSYRVGEADLTLTAFHLAQAQHDSALKSATDARKIFQEIEYYRLGEAILWEAKCYLALRHFPATRDCLTAANVIFARQRQPHHAAESKLVEAQMLYDESKDKEHAINMIAEAKAIFEELGLKHLEKTAMQSIEALKSCER